MERIGQYHVCIAYQSDKVQRIDVVERVVGKAFIASDIFVEIRQLNNLVMGCIRKFLGLDALFGIVAEEIA